MAAGPVASAGYLVCLRVKLAVRRRLVWCPGTVRKGSKRMRRVERGGSGLLCGRRAVKRCIGAKETREGARDAQQKETIAGSGSSLTHTDVLHGGSNTAFTSSRGVLVDLAPGVQCVQTALQRSTARLGCQVAHLVGGASRLCELSQAALTRWHWGHTTGAWYDVCTLVRPSDSFSVGASENRAFCR